ncbi:S-adenosyl-L-methionine-dependent methyltransferase [Purpureocillium lavendulum]|uniref:S-adenosyl-L-methionine-dependent methyltransferase n=1 Tax=Purpureocillium lavendulum TaxID=1247861 RepID=A0AB34FV41_9HYPO|nr:S-adenosyl-L-methionine-dependent methyltransferase [Purpureocillium lavendulum]
MSDFDRDAKVSSSGPGTEPPPGPPQEQHRRGPEPVQPPTYSASPAAADAPPAAAPPMSAAAAPLPQNATRPFPQYQSQFQNTGMAAGAMVGAMSGGQGSVGGDIVMGGVVGGMVGQRVAQAQNHAYWRDQAMQYREGRAAGTIPPPSELYEDQKASWWSREGRAQRRAARWERRAKRRDGL